MKITRTKLSKLTLDPKNARTHDKDNIAAIEASLKSFGQVEPLVVQKSTGRVIGGNGRLETMRKMGWEDAEVVELDIDDARAAALAIALNRTGELAGWSNEQLAETLKSLPDDLRLSTGFTDTDLGNLLDSLRPESPEDEVPTPPDNATSKPGDLWILGAHKILCGDATKPEDVKRLMGGERAVLMNTDPPYGIAYDNAALGPTRRDYAPVANDQLADKVLQGFLETCFRAAVAEALAPDAAWYLWHAHLTQGFFAAAAAAAANVVLHRQIIWVKPRLILGRGHYHWRHEPCFMGWVDGHQPPDYGRGSGERDQTTVWELAGVPDADRREYEHATPKPVALFEIPLVKHTKPGEICYEPFCGSAPQIIAANNTGRRCFALEIEPRYVDVAVLRWQKATEKTAVLEDGRSFADVAQIRKAV